MKTVSIIIPIYNSAETLPSCLGSVLASSYKALEVILLDDGSVDNSLDICREYAEKDGRIRVFHHENHGVSYTRNRGLDEMTGDYVMFVDADDTISEGWVEAYASAIEENEADMAIGSMTEIDISGKTHEKRLQVDGLFGVEIWQYIAEDKLDGYGYVPNKIYNREIIKDLRFDEQMIVQEDTDFTMRAIEKAKKTFVFHEAGYYYYYVPAKRETPYVGLLNNQVRLFNNYLKYCEKQETNVIEKLLIRINDLIELCLKQYTNNADWNIKYKELRDIMYLNGMQKASNTKKISKLLINGKFWEIHFILKYKLFFEKVKRGIRHAFR